MFADFYEVKLWQTKGINQEFCCIFVVQTNLKSSYLYYGDGGKNKYRMVAV